MASVICLVRQREQLSIESYLSSPNILAGDLLRAEQNREGSQYGAMIKQYIKDGQIVPMEVTVKLLENAMKAALEQGRPGEGWADGKGRFLVDGFPRKMDQALKFDEDVRWIPYTASGCITDFPYRFACPPWSCSIPRPRKSC